VRRWRRFHNSNSIIKRAPFSVNARKSQKRREKGSFFGQKEVLRGLLRQLHENELFLKKSAGST